ncbi:interleukin-36 gamma-like [Sorex araneus]|uniref:interleukin-36 gamma-like n=1 Tax=Sorex araneus TaxID=42254 RepID=UPI0024336F8B|nr:interleukin-36 gamma-like [Sorex araneus]
MTREGLESSLKVYVYITVPTGDIGMEQGLETPTLAAVSSESPLCVLHSNSDDLLQEVVISDLTARESPDFGEVSDLNHNVWILQDENIVSVPRKESVTPVTVTVLPCNYPVSPEKSTSFPIYLGIKDPEKCLSCEEIEGKPTLHLKDEKILDLYNKPGPVMNFLFYRDQDGRTCTFESVAFPGWFIASSDKGKPLFLTSNPGGTDNTAFIYIDYS